MPLRKTLCALAMITATTATAQEPLSQMEGNWRGSGWARETQSRPQETLRCQITNSYDAASLTLTLSGRCVVPGRRLSLEGRLKGTPGATRITGRWSNPDGIGSARIVGLQRDGIVAFNFNATDPATGRKIARNVEWRVAEDTLRLRATDRADPSIMMSDISFTR